MSCESRTALYNSVGTMGFCTRETTEESEIQHCTDLKQLFNRVKAGEHYQNIIMNNHMVVLDISGACTCTSYM